MKTSENLAFSEGIEMNIDLKWVKQVYRKKLPPEVFCKKILLKTSQYSPVLESLFIKFAKVQACNFITNRFQQGCFPVNKVKFLKTPRRTLSKNICERPLRPEVLHQCSWKHHGAMHYLWSRKLVTKCKIDDLLKCLSLEIFQTITLYNTCKQILDAADVKNACLV